MDEYHFDGYHPSTGYVKDYHYDSRFIFTLPPDFYEGTQAQDDLKEIHVLHSPYGGLNFTESHVENVGEILQTLWMDSDGGSVLIAYQTIVDYNSFHFLNSNDDPQDYEHYVVESNGTRLINAHIYGNEIYVLSELWNDNFIYRYQVGNPIPELIHSPEQVYYLSDFTVSESGALAYAYNPEYHPEVIQLDFRYDNGTSSMMGLATWDYLFGPYSAADSHISIKLDENNRAYTTILKDIDENSTSIGELYLISGELDGIVKINEDEIIPPRISMQIYPNPFNPETTISFSVPQTSSFVMINIYNVKGQK